MLNADGTFGDASNTSATSTTSPAQQDPQQPQQPATQGPGDEFGQLLAKARGDTAPASGGGDEFAQLLAKSRAGGDESTFSRLKREYWDEPGEGLAAAEAAYKKSHPDLTARLAAIATDPNSSSLKGGAAMLASMATGAVQHPIDTFGALTTAPFKSAFDFGTGIGQKIARKIEPEDEALQESAHGAQTDNETLAAGAQTLANMVAPGAGEAIFNKPGVINAIGSRPAAILQHGLTGAAIGATYAPDHPIVGGLAGLVLGGGGAALGGARNTYSVKTPVDIDPNGPEWENQDVYDGKRTDIHRETDASKLLGKRAEPDHVTPAPTATATMSPDAAAQAPPAGPDFEAELEKAQQDAYDRLVKYHQDEKARAAASAAAAEARKPTVRVAPDATPTNEAPDYEVQPNTPNTPTPPPPAPADELEALARKARGEPAAPTPAPDNSAAQFAYDDLTPESVETLKKVTDDDGVKRWANARTAADNRRDIADVSTAGLIDELNNLDRMRQSAGDRAQYRWTPDDNFHSTSDGRSVVAADNRGPGPSRQAKALTNLDDNIRITSDIHDELQRRGIAFDDILDKMEERKHERAGLADESIAKKNTDGFDLFEQSPKLDLFGNHVEPTVQQGNLFDGVPAPSTKGKGTRLDTPITADEMAKRRDELGAEPNAAEKSATDNLNLFEPAAKLSPLAGTRVVDDAGQPRRVYHGTARSFESFDPSKSDPNALYGPGYYFTEDPDIASDYTRKGVKFDRDELTARIEKNRRALDEGMLGGAPLTAEQRPLVERSVREDETKLAKAGTIAPNVRPARLGITHPFDADAGMEYDGADVQRVLDAAERVMPSVDWDYAREILQGREETHNLSGTDVYGVLSKMVDAHGVQAKRAGMNQILRAAGYDGITHVGGQVTGGKPHRVWIAFDRSQVRSAFDEPEHAMQVGEPAGDGHRVRDVRALDADEARIALPKGAASKLAELHAKIEQSGLPTSQQRLAEVKPVKRGRLWTDLRGLQLDSPQKMYHALAAYRSPIAERFHMVTLNDHYKVTSHVAQTSGALSYVSGITKADLDDLAERAKRTGAKRVLFAHNHPSGDPTPSTLDHAATKQAAAYLKDAHGLDVVGHIITDHDEATWLTPTYHGLGPNDVSQVYAPAAAHGAPWVPATRGNFPALKSPRDWAPYIIGLNHPDALTVLYLDTQNRVVAVEPRPIKSWTSIENWLPQMLRAHGALRAVVGSSSASIDGMIRNGSAEALAKAGKLMDVVRVDHDADTGLPTAKSAAEYGAIHPDERGELLGDIKGANPSYRLSEPPAGGGAGGGATGPAGGTGGAGAGAGRGAGGPPGAPPGGPPAGPLPGAAGGAGGGSQHVPHTPGPPPPNFLKRGALKVLSFPDDIRKLFAPDTRGPESAMGGAIIRSNEGARDQSEAQARKALDEFSKAFDRMPEPKKGQTMAELMANPRFAFIHAVETGAPLADPIMDRAAKMVRKVLDTDRAQVQALGTGALKSFYLNYFPHAWENPNLAGDTFDRLWGRRPAQGSKSFLKERTHFTTEEGLDAGLWPVSTNPIDLVLVKHHEMQKFISAQKTWTEYRAKGLVKYVAQGQFATRPPAGYERIADPIAKVFAGKNIGTFWAPEPVALVFNRYYGPGGMRGNGIYDLLMYPQEKLNMAQLGLSYFHAGMTTLNSSASDVALGVHHLLDGNVGKAVLATGRGLTPLASVTHDVTLGHQIINEYYEPGSSKNPLVRMMAKAVADAGGVVQPGQGWDSGALKAFGKARRQGAYGTMAAQAFPAAWEGVMSPIMRGLVPRVKVGAFAKLALRQVEALGQHSTPEQQRFAIQQAWNSVDNRFGQYVYRNKFWEPHWKDAMHFGVRAPGWTGGTIGEVGGGLMDAGRMANDVAHLRAPKLTPRTAYAGALVASVAWMGALTMLALSGKWPETPKDYFYPRTGEKNTEGNDERLQLPTYMKDAINWGTRPVQTAIDKLAPGVNLAVDLMQNRDFYGDEIFNPDDSPLKRVEQKAAYAGKQFLPFTVRNMQEQQKREQPPLVKGLGYVGVTAAPRTETRTDAQNRMIDLAGLAGHPVATPEESAARQKMRDLKTSLREGHAQGNDQAGLDSVKAAIARGELTKRQLSAMEKSTVVDPWTTRFNGLPVQQAVDVWQRGTPAERQQWKPILIHKIINARKQGTRIPTPPGLTAAPQP